MFNAFCTIVDMRVLIVRDLLDWVVCIEPVGKVSEVVGH